MATCSEVILTGVPLAVPLLLAALGETIAEQSGVINVGIEGMVLCGALAGFAGAYAAHNPFAGLAAAASAGLALAALFGLLTVRLRADQAVTGTAVNILALGLTGVFSRAWFAQGVPNAPSFANWSVPILCRLPLVGPALFSQNLLGYLAFLLVPATWYWLYRTRPGLQLRASGEYPAAARAAGVNVPRMRFCAVLWAGALAGISGAYLSIGYTSGFVENMSAGRGFIALAIVILGRWNPVGIVIAALLFGCATALQFIFQASSSHIPYQFFLALPYLLTLAALLFRTRLNARPPAALGEAS